MTGLVMKEKGEMKRVLRPDWRKLVLFAVLIAIAIGGHIVATPGCGDWFEIVFERDDGTSYSLGYHHGPEAGTLVYHKGEQVGSARAPREFHAAMATIVEPFLARHGEGWQGTGC